MKFILLTHAREFEKRSNTGRVVVDVLGGAAEQVRWDRVHPPARLVEEIEAGGVALIYPGAADAAGNDLTAPPGRRPARSTSAARTCTSSAGSA